MKQFNSQAQNESLIASMFMINTHKILFTKALHFITLWPPCFYSPQRSS